MLNLDLIFQALFLIACLVVLFRAEPATNLMTRKTPRPIRVSFNCLASAALGGILYTLGGTVPHWLAVLLAIGIAALLICDRRVRVLTGIRSINPKDKGPSHA